MSLQRFRTTLQLDGRTATGIAVPSEVVESRGARKPETRADRDTQAGQLLHDGGKW